MILQTTLKNPILLEQGKYLKILELFGGIASASKALLKMGILYKSLDYVEIDTKAVRSYNALSTNWRTNQADALSVLDYIAHLTPHILIHGSPCQDYSRSGQRWGGKDEDKTRSSLMHETLRIVESMGRHKPEVIIWENVAGVLDKDMIQGFQQYLKELENLGYENSYEVLNSMDFGIPQNRNRIYVISLLNGESFDFSTLKRKPCRPISDFLEPDEEVSDRYTVKQPSMLNKLADLNTDHTNKNYQRFIPTIKDFAWTITTRQDRCPNSGVIKRENGDYRYLTERETFRLMGYSDYDFDILEKAHPIKRQGAMNYTLYKQAGNSIVVDVLVAIYESLIENYLKIQIDREEPQLDLFEHSHGF